MIWLRKPGFFLRFGGLPVWGKPGFFTCSRFFVLYTGF